LFGSGFLLDNSNEAWDIIFRGLGWVNINLQYQKLARYNYTRKMEASAQYRASLTSGNILEEWGKRTLLFEKSSFTPLPELECAIVL
jgi:hypothetical protein